MEIRISNFTIESYDRVLDLWKQCGEGIGLSDSDSRENIQLYLDRNPGMSLIAELDNELAGVILAGHDGSEAIYITWQSLRLTAGRGQEGSWLIPA